MHLKVLAQVVKSLGVSASKASERAKLGEALAFVLSQARAKATRAAIAKGLRERYAGATWLEQLLAILPELLKIIAALLGR